MQNAMTAGEVIGLLGLRPLDGEGGYVTETYRSTYTLDVAMLRGLHGGDGTAKMASSFLVTIERLTRIEP